MFERIPSADAVFMKVFLTNYILFKQKFIIYILIFWKVLLLYLQRILHDWDDEHCLKILKWSYEAIPEDGRILIVDAVIENEEGTKKRVGLLSDVLMMAVSIGGKERTEDEFKDLFYKAGFKSYNVIELPYYHKLIEVSKK